jgi:hypothetical protein
VQRNKTYNGRIAFKEKRSGTPRSGTHRYGIPWCCKEGLNQGGVGRSKRYFLHGLRVRDGCGGGGGGVGPDREGRFYS